MKATHAGFGWRMAKRFVLVVALALAVAGSAWGAHRFRSGGSFVTNANAFAAEQVAVGLRLAVR